MLTRNQKIFLKSMECEGEFWNLCSKQEYRTAMPLFKKGLIVFGEVPTKDTENFWCRLSDDGINAAKKIRADYYNLPKRLTPNQKIFLKSLECEGQFWNLCYKQEYRTAMSLYRQGYIDFDFIPTKDDENFWCSLTSK